MHYAFDRWIRSKMPQCRFARYADDAVVHCQTEQQARDLKDQLAERLIACGLQLHPDKTRIVYCRDSNRRGDYPVTQFTFLGFTFRPREAVARNGKLFTSFLPAVSREAQTQMRQTIGAGGFLTKHRVPWPSSRTPTARRCEAGGTTTGASILRPWSASLSTSTWL